MTLLELLAVFAIIVLLAALILPAILSGREVARRSVCRNNMRQIGLAIHLHHDALGRLPSGWTADMPLGIPGWGWAATILPYLEETEIEPQHFRNFGQAIRAARNREFRQMVVPLYLCPSDPAPKIYELRVGDVRGLGNGSARAAQGGPPLFPVARSNYAGVFGTQVIEDFPGSGDGTFFFNSRLRFGQITDGLSKTFIVGERSSRLGNSTWVGVVPGAHRAMAQVVGRSNHVPNDILGHYEDFGSYHPFGAHFLFGDGSVRLISDEIDLTTYHALASRAKSEIISGDEFAVYDVSPGDVSVAGGNARSLIAVSVIRMVALANTHPTTPNIRQAEGAGQMVPVAAQRMH